jgi:hypothetical protein
MCEPMVGDLVVESNDGTHTQNVATGSANS